MKSILGKNEVSENTPGSRGTAGYSDLEQSKSKSSGKSRGMEPIDLTEFVVDHISNEHDDEQRERILADTGLGMRA